MECVVKLAKKNKVIKYLLVVVDILHVEPLKSKYATTTANEFKKMIKTSDLKNCE